MCARVVDTCPNGRLYGRCPAHSRAMHQPPLRQIVILDCTVLHRAIVPHKQVSRTPPVPVDEFGLHDMIRESGNQRLSFVRFQTLDACTIVAHDVQALFPGVWMRSNDRMSHRWITINLLLSRRKGTLAAGEIEYSAPPFNPMAEWIR